MHKSENFELRRQSIHFLGLAYIIASYFLSFWLMLAVIIITLFIAATHAFFRPIAKKVPLIKNISNFLDSFARKGEKEGRIYWGATTLFLGLLIVFVAFPNQPEIWRTAALVVILGDSVSTMVGTAWGKKKLPWNRNKSWIGFNWGFLFAFAGALTQVAPQFAFIVALIGMIVESLPVPVNDNFTIPVVVSIVLWGLLLI